METLRLFPQPGTVHDDVSGIDRIKLYDSSLSNAETGEPLLSLHSNGRGLRLTIAQAEELRDWLTGWLEEQRSCPCGDPADCVEC
jgi:hypothetical protein